MAYPSDLVRTKNWGTETLTDTDLEGQLDLIINWVDAFADETSGHKHDGTSNEGPKIILTSAVTGTLPLANGGTGQTSLAALGNLFYPVGSIYMNDEVSTNPGTLLGFGTWTAITGKMIIGVDGGDADFDAAKETGGAKTYDLSHDHTGFTGGVSFSGAVGSDTAGTLDTKHRHSISSDGSATQSVMNPFYAAYIWRRSV